MAHMFKHNKHLQILGKQVPEAKITWNVTENPRVAGKRSYARFADRFGAATVAEYKARGGNSADLLWDLRSGVISVEGMALGGLLEQRRFRTKKEKPAADTTIPGTVEEVIA